jgi:hypothetical protein
LAWWQRDNTPAALCGCLLEHLHDSIQVIVVPVCDLLANRMDLIDDGVCCRR